MRAPRGVAGLILGEISPGVGHISTPGRSASTRRRNVGRSLVPYGLLPGSSVDISKVRAEILGTRL